MAAHQNLVMHGIIDDEMLRRVCIYSTVDGEISRTADGLRQYLGRLANAVASNTQ
jgi:hypothetical protein